MSPSQIALITLPIVIVAATSLLIAWRCLRAAEWLVVGGRRPSRKRSMRSAPAAVSWRWRQRESVRLASSQPRAAVRL